MKSQLLTVLILAASSFALASSTTATPPASVQVQAKTPLGDLSKFRVIAVDTLKIAKTGDLKAAEKRITDFETAWDVAAKKMKAMNPKSWRTLDLALDRVLFELRADKPTVALCTKTLEDILVVMDTLK